MVDVSRAPRPMTSSQRAHDEHKIEFEKISTILGDHMKSVEFLPLQRWQINAIHAAYNT